MAAPTRLARVIPLALMLGAGAALTEAAWPQEAWAQETGDSMAGRTYALQHCSECHNVGAGRQQPIQPGAAPDFTAIANARTTTPLGLAVFLNTPHAKMPNFVIAEGDRHNIIAYIVSLRRKAKAGQP